MIKKFLFGDNIVSKIVRLFINYLPLNNSIHALKNEIYLSNAVLRNSKIQINGQGNKVIFGKNVYLMNLNILITGDKNEILIKDYVVGDQVDICIEDEHNTISVGTHTNFSGKIHLACTESTGIYIGENCLFSSEIVVRTGDSHSIFDNTGKRINTAASVKIGDHVWVGHRVLITKGSEINQDSVVGTGAIVTKKIDRANVVIAGVPARVVSENINWNKKRVKCGVTEEVDTVQ